MLGAQVRVPELGVRDMVGNAVWDQFERSFIQRIPLAQGNGSTIGYQGWVGVFNRGPVPFPGPVTLLDKRYELFECTRAWVLLASVNKGFRRVIRERYMKLMAEVESQFAMDEAEYSEAVMRYINSHPNDDIYSLSKDEREARVGMKKPGMNHPMDIVIHEIDKAGMKYIVAANVDDKYGGWYSPWENTMKVSLSTHLGWGEAQSGDLYGRLKKLIYQGRYKVSHMCFLSTIMPLECSVCKKKKYKGMMDTMDPCVIWGSIMARVCHECQRSSWRELTSVCIM